MEESWIIDAATCKACGLCGDVCPNRSIHKDASGKMVFRSDRLATCIRCGQCMAVCPTQSMHVPGFSYERDFIDLPKQTGSESLFFDLITSRRAVRNFQDKPVPRELLEKIVRAIAFAPPSFTPIKTELVVVQNTELIRRALPHMIAFFDFMVGAMKNPVMQLMISRRAGREKFNVIRQHMVPLMKTRLPDLKAGTEDTITRGAPAMILFHANRDAENYRADAYIALTYGFLAAHALGLGGSAMDIIPPAIERSKELRAMFAIPDTNEVVASMIVGYPKYRYQRAIKRDLHSVTWL
ncbi:MAG: nitroreductase family protein [Anaerolineae bacterium]|nr:nitroreductase family protein [Anaerolineae bacterium]